MYTEQGKNQQGYGHSYGFPVFPTLHWKFKCICAKEQRGKLFIFVSRKQLEEGNARMKLPLEVF